MKRMVVDGEHFDVSERAREPGVHDIVWASGPNEGYGFASASYGNLNQTDEDLEEAIRNFLSQINPATGYID